MSFITKLYGISWSSCLRKGSNRMPKLIYNNMFKVIAVFPGHSFVITCIHFLGV